MKTKLRSLAVALVLGLGLTTSAVAAPQLAFDPVGPYNVTAGSTLDVGLRITDLGSEIVSAFDLDVLFDNTVLDPVQVTFDAVPLMGGIADTLFDAIFPLPGDPGILSVSTLSFLTDAEIAALQAPAGGSFSLFTITFDVLADATTAVELGLLDATAGKDVKGSNNVPIIPTGQVPEPGTLALLALALAGLATRRRLPV